MQTQFLKLYAPTSLYLLFHPADTGIPNYDFQTHLEKFANPRINSDISATNNRKLFNGNLTRIDLESNQLIGGRVIGRVEMDLGSDEAEQQHQILSIPYAQKRLNNIENAIELVRVITQAVCAASNPILDPLQVWAS